MSIKPEVLIFRDFVNQYNEDKKKVNNLVFVILRPAADGVGNTIDYVDNFAQAKCNSAYHATCLDFLFQREDLFPRGTTVFISGDHGPHFWCWDTLAYQSTVFGKYGLKLHICWLMQLSRVQSLRCAWSEHQEGSSGGAAQRRWSDNSGGVRAPSVQHASGRGKGDHGMSLC